MGFKQILGGIAVDRDFRPEAYDESEGYSYVSEPYPSLYLLSTSAINWRKSEFLHIFLILRDRESHTFEVFSELDIDRNTKDEYLYEEVGYNYEGRYYKHFALIRVNPKDDSIVEWFEIDIDNLRFVTRTPYEDMEVLWQEP